MNIIFRVDSSTIMGTGHVMRCITLAKQLQDVSRSIHFISRDLPGNISSMIEANDFNVILLENVRKPKDLMIEKEDWLSVPWEEDAADTIRVINQFETKPDLLIVDHYGIDSRWEEELSQFVESVFVIDDLANREHYCDFLLDQNYYINAQNRYEKLVLPRTKLLLGPDYALLRSEFYKVKEQLNRKFNTIKTVLIFMGGSDSDNVSQLMIESLVEYHSSIKFKIVLGKNNPNKNKIKSQINKLENAEYYEQVNNIAHLFATSDLSIGAGGTATWERCYLGLPTLTVTVADNQIEMTENTSDFGAIYYLGHIQNISKKVIRDSFDKLISDQELLRTMSEKSMVLMKKNKKNIIKEILVESLCHGNRGDTLPQ